MSVVDNFTVTRLGEVLIFLRKFHILFLAVFQDPVQLVHTI